MEHDLPKSSEAMEIAEEARAAEYVNPSFGGQLFVGRFASELLHPFPLQPESDKKEADSFINDLTDYLQKHLDPDLVDATREIPKNVIQEMARLGVFAMKIPKKYEGLGFSQANYNRTMMRVASFCASTAVLISAHQSIGVPQPLLLYGTEEQKKKYFPRFRKGAISAFALTEIDVGSDPARMSTEAKLSPDGKHYILNGAKLWCTNGTIADVIIVVAKTTPKVVKGKERQQITAFILEMNTPGVKVVHRCDFMGLKGIYNGLIQFNDVKIPVENRLGEEGRGLAIALATVNVGRLTLPAGCTGAAKLCLSIARRWSKERVQWGQPIGLHEAGREKLSYIAATTLAMEAVTWLTSHWQDEGKVDIRIEAAMAKLFCTEALWTISDMTMQLRGGRGYENASSLKKRGEVGYPVERIMRDSRINTILEGSSEIMKLFLSREAMEPHLKRLTPLLKGKAGFGTILKLIGHYSLWYPSQWVKQFFLKPHKEMGPFAEEFRFIEKESHRMARHLFFYMAKYQKKLEYKQMILGRLIDIGTDLFVMAATCSYAKSLGTEEATELAHYFSKIAKTRVQNNFNKLRDNNDKSMCAIGKAVVEGKFTWLEEGIIPFPLPDK